MPIKLSDEEIDSLAELPHFLQSLYIFGIRRYMDYGTGITGIKRKISRLTLAQEIYIAPHRGKKNTGSYSTDQIKRGLLELQKSGLIELKSHKKQLILRCLLALTDESIQNKAAQKPPEQAAQKPTQEEIIETPIKIDDCEETEIKSAQEAAHAKNRKPPSNPVSGKIHKDIPNGISMSGRPDDGARVEIKNQAIDVLNFLNKKTGRQYRAVETNLKLIMARLKSGASVDDCRQVIAKKTREWKGDPKMAEYLRPATLFNATKFEQYLGELVLPEADEIQTP